MTGTRRTSSILHINNVISVNEYFGYTAELLRPKKKTKIENLSSITLAT